MTMEHIKLYGDDDEVFAACTWCNAGRSVTDLDDLLSFVSFHPTDYHKYKASSALIVETSDDHEIVDATNPGHPKVTANRRG